MGSNSNPTHVYWDDGSYIRTTVSQGTKVSYTNDNHSAVTTETANVFISKWGDGPLVRHLKDRCLYESTGLNYYKAHQNPDYYIGRYTYDYDPNYTIYATGGYAGISVSAYSNSISPTRYEWSAVFYGDCDRYYIWPSGARADLSVYLNNNNYGGTLRVECKMYNGSTLLETCYYYLSVYNQQRTNIKPHKDKTINNNKIEEETAELQR